MREENLVNGEKQVAWRQMWLLDIFGGQKGGFNVMNRTCVNKGPIVIGCYCEKAGCRKSIPRQALGIGQ
jgi:hypothetical protein